MKRIIVLTILFLFLIPEMHAQVSPRLDSLETELKKAPQKERSKLFGLLSVGYRSVDAGRASQFASEQIDLALKNKSVKELVSGYYNKGATFNLAKHVNTDSAIYYFVRSLSANSGSDKKLEGMCYRSIATSYSLGGNYKTGINAAFRALNLFEAMHDTLNTAATLNDLGNMYLNMLNYSTARKLFWRAIKEYENLGLEATKGVSLNNVGCSYMDQYILDSASVYFRQALDIARRNNSKYLEALCLNNMGIILEKSGEKDHQKVIDHYSRALELCREQKSNQEKHALLCLGAYYVKINDFKNGEKYLNELLLLAKKENSKKDVDDCYHGLADLYLKKGDHKKAHDFLRKYTELKDTILDENAAKQVSEMEARYQNEKKQREITMLQKDNEIHQLNLGRSRTQNFVLGGGIVMLLFGSLGFFQWYKLRQKQTLSTELMRQQELRLSAIVAAQETERKRIAKDLHDGVGQLLSSLKLDIQQIKDQAPDHALITEKLKRSFALLDETATEVRNISHQMMPRVLEEVGLVSALEDMLNKSFRSTDVSFEFDHGQIPNRFERNTEVALYRIAQELVNNVIKHAEAKEISLQLFTNRGSVILVVEDNGKGFDFDPNNPGHGLMNIITRAKAERGTVSFERGPRHGMVATVRIPIV